MKKPAKTKKQLAALAGVALLVIFYLATPVAAFADFPGSDRLFAALLVCDIGLPILLWIYLWLIRKVQERKQEAKDQFDGLS